MDGKKQYRKKVWREKESGSGKVAVSAPKLTTRILSSRVRAIFLPHWRHCTRGSCMPLWHNNVHCTSEQCYPSVSLYSESLSHPRIVVTFPPYRVAGAHPFFFGLFEEINDRQLRRMRIARVISNKHHKIEKLMS